MKWTWLLIFLFLSAPVSWADNKPLNVVTTQTLFADLVKQVGGEKVIVRAIASAK